VLVDDIPDDPWLDALVLVSQNVADRRNGRPRYLFGESFHLVRQ